MKNIKEINLIFENCESIKLQPKNIGLLDISNLHERIQRTAINSIDKIITADTFAIEIFPENISSSSLFFGEETPAKERLIKYNDITSVNIVYEDDTEESIFVAWGEESDFENEYQKTKVSSLGNIYIIIDKEKELSDIFDDDYINNEEEVNFRKKWC